MGTLYILSVPAYQVDDLTLRAVRILRQVELAVTNDLDATRALWARLDLSTPIANCSQIQMISSVLAEHDVAILLRSNAVLPTPACARIIHTALAQGWNVVPIPGPSLVITALVISGLPASSFVYLGILPLQQAQRERLLARFSAETRTLVLGIATPPTDETLDELHAVLGERPLVVVCAQQTGTRAVWRSSTGPDREPLPNAGLDGQWMLVLGGAQPQVTRWPQDRLEKEIRACLQQELGARETSRRLAKQSGWRRNEIYQLLLSIKSDQ